MESEREREGKVNYTSQNLGCTGQRRIKHHYAILVHTQHASSTEIRWIHGEQNFSLAVVKSESMSKTH
jgi:hypothetical protein